MYNMTNEIKAVNIVLVNNLVIFSIKSNDTLSSDCYIRLQLSYINLMNEYVFRIIDKQCKDLLSQGTYKIYITDVKHQDTAGDGNVNYIINYDLYIHNNTDCKKIITNSVSNSTDSNIDIDTNNSLIINKLGSSTTINTNIYVSSPQMWTKLTGKTFSSYCKQILYKIYNTAIYIIELPNNSDEYTDYGSNVYCNFYTFKSGDKDKDTDTYTYSFGNENYEFYVYNKEYTNSNNTYEVSTLTYEQLCNITNYKETIDYCIPNNYADLNNLFYRYLQSQTQKSSNNDVTVTYINQSITEVKYAENVNISLLYQFIFGLDNIPIKFYVFPNNSTHVFNIDRLDKDRDNKTIYLKFLLLSSFSGNNISIIEDKEIKVEDVDINLLNKFDHILLYNDKYIDNIYGTQNY